MSFVPGICEWKMIGSIRNESGGGLNSNHPTRIWNQAKQITNSTGESYQLNCGFLRETQRNCHVRVEAEQGFKAES